MFAGDLGDPRIPDRNRRHMADAEQMTAANGRLTLVFAFNYGSRREMTEAARRLASDAIAGDLDPADIDEEVFVATSTCLDIPDLDLVVRSWVSTASRILLWQAAYAELVSPGILWPDFDQTALLDCVIEYQRRQRRFGGAEGVAT